VPRISKLTLETREMTLACGELLTGERWSEKKGGGLASRRGAPISHFVGPVSAVREEKNDFSCAHERKGKRSERV